MHACIDRTFKNLLYANTNTFDHFTMLLQKYHHVTHKGGKVCVRDRYVLRRLTDSMQVDTKVVKEFSLLASPHRFHSDDLEKVFRKYLLRVETMIGNEISRHLVEDVLVKGVGRLESLRQTKQDRAQQIKMDASQEGGSEKPVPSTELAVQCTDAPAKRPRAKGKKKKKYKRKKKKW